MSLSQLKTLDISDEHDLEKVKMINKKLDFLMKLQNSGLTEPKREIRNKVANSRLGDKE